MTRRTLSHEVVFALAAYMFAPLVFYSRGGGIGFVVGFAGLVPGIFFLYTEKKNSFVRFHSMQSLVFFGAVYLLLAVVDFIPILVTKTPFDFISIIVWLTSLLLSPVFSAVIFVSWVLLLWKTYSKEMYYLPYFGKLAERSLERVR